MPRGTKHPKDWARLKKTKSEFRQQLPPYEKVYIGNDPLDGMSREDAEKFDVFINVSDTPCNLFWPLSPKQRLYWYPINESGRWGYGPFFWFKRIMDQAYADKKVRRIYIHCHAGAHRSPAMFYWWLVSRGHSRVDAAQYKWRNRLKWDRKHKLLVWPDGERTLKDRRSAHRHFIYQGDIDDGHIPPNLPKLYEIMDKHPTWSLGSCLIYGKVDTTFEVLAKSIYEVSEENFQKKRKGIKNFMDDLKDLVRDKKRDLKWIHKKRKDLLSGNRIQDLKRRNISLYDLIKLLEEHKVW